MYLVFYKTSDVFEVEELLNQNCIDNEVVPTPVQDKAYCGVCLKVKSTSTLFDLIKNYEYTCIE